MADDTYAALLDLALTGKIKMIFGGPPCRTFSALRSLASEDGGPRPLRAREGGERWGRNNLSEWEMWRVRQDTIMVFRMLFLWMVAAVTAQGAGDKRPDFIMEHPEDPNEYLKAGGKSSQWALLEFQSLVSSYRRSSGGMSGSSIKVLWGILAGSPHEFWRRFHVLENYSMCVGLLWCLRRRRIMMEVGFDSILLVGFLGSSTEGGDSERGGGQSGWSHPRAPPEDRRKLLGAPPEGPYSISEGLSGVLGRLVSWSHPSSRGGP